MNYIQYNDTKIPLKCSYRVIKAMKEQFGVDITSSLITEWYNDFKNQEALFFAMIQEGYRQQKTECPYKFEDMQDILNEEGIYSDCIQVFTKDVVSFVTPNSDKKKLVETIQAN